MNDDNNEEFFKGGISELSSSLKKEFTTSFDGLKNQFEELKLGLNKDEKKDVDTMADFVEHLNSCDNDDCDIHRAKNSHGNNMYMKGFVLGAKFGKAKRS